MSNWLSDYSGEDQQQVDQLNSTGIAHQPTKQKEVGLFDGAASSIPRGAVAGTIKAIDVVSRPFQRIADHVEYSLNDGDDFSKPLDVREPSFNDVYAEKNKERQDTLVMEVERLEDAQNTGTVGNIGFSLGDYLTRAVIGSVAGGLPGAVGLTGASESNYVYQNLTNKGVDSTTATEVALTDGLVAGVATALPITYGFRGFNSGTTGLLKDAALSIGGATGLMTGGQYVSGQLLENGEYTEQAKRYEITSEGVATNVILNTLFFGAARGAKRLQQSSLDSSIDAEINALDSDTIQARTDLVDHTLAINDLDFDQASPPVRTLDPIQQNNHLSNLDTARTQLESGQPVRIDREVKGAAKPRFIDYETTALPINAKTIARKAKQDGIDPSVALTISHIETGGSFSHSAQNPTSTANGLFQVLDKTWKGLGGGDRTNVDEQIRIGLKHIKQANSAMRKSLGREPVAHEQYLGHLLGPSGASKVLKADPNANLIDIVRKYDSKNADDIVNNNGMKGLTVAQAIGKWESKWNSLSTRYGGSDTHTALGMDGSSYDFAYEVKSLNELIASNDQMYGVNPNYPAELQPRDRTREASRQQIETMANDLRPELLGESNMLSNGAPIIGMDNVVESGNGRTMAIGKAYENGRAEEYRQFVNDFANNRGLDISDLNNPVLVRTRLTETNRTDFARLANESDVSQFSATERALTDADRLPDTSLLRLNGDGNINLDQSMDFVRGFIDSLPTSERSSAITPEGRLSQDGKRRIESALTQRAYGDSSLVSRMAESLDDEGKTVLNALLRVAPQIAQLSDLVKQGGRFQNTIASDVAQAAQKFSDLKASNVRVQDYLNQGQLIDDGLSAGAKDFLNVFDTNKRSAKAIGENIQGKIDEVESRGDPRQGSLFGDTPEEKVALDIILNNPDQLVTVSRTNSKGEVEEITMSLRERLDELEADAVQAQQDTLAAQTAITCALQFG